jgi:hypothetical protein
MPTHKPHRAVPEMREPTPIIAAVLTIVRAVAPHLGDVFGTASLGRQIVYTQKDGERPPGCSPTKFLRTWRRARDAADAGATEDGRTRLLTVEAYERHRTRERSRRVPPRTAAPAPRSIDEEMLARLGGRERRAR